jgi:4a-hydroxytetrahydrobiopterin dehydratase
MAKEAVLSAEALEKATEGLAGWELVGGELVRVVEFRDFVAAMEFVNRVAEQAEAAGHHPDIDIRYNKVRLALVTHDSGGITAKDVEMAAALSGDGGAT